MARNRKSLTSDDVLYLQRTIGNAATMRFVSDLKPQTEDAHPVENTLVSRMIQRFPSVQEVKDRSDKKSNKGGLTKKFKEVKKKQVSLYQQVIDGVELYNLASQKHEVEHSLQTRKQSYDLYNNILEDIRQHAQDYIAKHESTLKRPKTVQSFKQLLTEIKLDRDLVLEIVNDSYYDSPKLKIKWADAIKGKSTRTNEFAMALAAELGLPLSFLRTLPNETLGTMSRIHEHLGKGDVADIRVGFEVLRKALPNGSTFNLIRTSLLRKHIAKLNPELNEVITNQNYEQKSPESMAAGRRGLMGGQEANLLTANQSMGRYETELSAEDKAIHQAATGDKAVKAGLITEAQFVANFKARRGWEKENVNLDAFKNLQDHEKEALSGYTQDFTQFVNPLRGDLTPGKGEDDFNQSKLGRVQNLVSALNKLPPYSGTVYRHDADFPGFLDINRVGGTTSDMSVLSTTREANTLKKIVGSADPNVLTILKSKTGRFVKPISSYNSMKDIAKDENEVLFKPGTQFQVVARYDARKGPDGQFMKPYIFPPDMDSSAKAALNADMLKGDIRIIIIKEEI